MNKSVDVLIVGGGLVGASLMRALTEAGFDALLVEAKPLLGDAGDTFDARSLALSPASVHILQMLGVWSSLTAFAGPINTVHVSEKKGFGSARLQAEQDTPLGFIVELQQISRALIDLLPPDKIIAPAELITLDKQQGTACVRTPDGEIAIKAQLIVAADGAHSSVRKLCGLVAETKWYNQHALVANIGLARSHQNIAYERFTKTGPMAILPMTGQRASLVWALPPEEVERLMGLSEADFLKKLQESFGYRLGRFMQVGRRASFPLQQMLMRTQVDSHVVFIGNAAHALHPVAGQGFNLGLRDVAMLTQCLVEDGISTDVLSRYQQSRQHDQRSISYFTDSLVGLFTSRIPGIATARRCGLVAFDNTPFLKRLLSRYARGFSGVTPDLVCGIPLSNREIS